MTSRHGVVRDSSDGLEAIAIRTAETGIRTFVPENAFLRGGANVNPGSPIGGGRVPEPAAVPQNGVADQ